MDDEEVLVRLANVRAALEQVNRDPETPARSALARMKLTQLSELHDLIDSASPNDLEQLEAELCGFEEWTGLREPVDKTGTGRSAKLLSTAATRALGTFDRAKKAVTQETAWADVQTTVDTLVEVVRTQHAMTLDLLDRVSQLERSVNGIDGPQDHT